MTNEEIKNYVADATGALPIPMTNDYLFRALHQRDNYALKGLISSLLRIPAEDIASVEITNPIELGKKFKDKDFVLDIKILLNNSTIINLEMQVINQFNWTDRSLSYLCRTFDQLNSGDSYSDTKPVIQIGLLDFTLFPEHPEFYATYQFLNIKNHTLYNDKLTLSVVDLTHIELATEKDIYYYINHWAALFKAKTWEEINMLAKENTYIENATNPIYLLTQEEAIREQCEAREDYYRTQRTLQNRIQTAEQRYEDLKIVISKQETLLSKQEALLSEKDAEIVRLKAALAEK